MTAAKKSEPAVAAKPARRRTVSAAKAEPSNTRTVPEVVVDPGSTAKRSTKRAPIGVLKISAASAETTVKRAAAATGKTPRVSKA